MTARSIASRGVLALSIMLLAALPSSASAWNAAGHRLAAAIAWDNMKPEIREEATRLLHLHPDHAHWLKRAGNDDTDRKVFIEASTWPDVIRKDTRFYSAGIEEPTPTLPGFPDMERRANWHYVNIPLDTPGNKTPISGMLDRQLVELPKTLVDSDSEHKRAYVLPWIIHLAAEAHQPLHTSARRATEDKWDKLGNGLEVQNPFNSRKPVSTLHAFWDDLPGPPWLKGERLDAAARALMAAHPRPGRMTSSKHWIEESWLIARDSAYPAEDEAVPVISEAFFENSRKIADQRIALAGYRLADLLNRVLAPASRKNQR